MLYLTVYDNKWSISCNSKVIYKGVHFVAALL